MFCQNDNCVSVIARRDFLENRILRPESMVYGVSSPI
jgi:hypothetical protein